MKTADFTGELAPNGQISVPAEIAPQVPQGEQVQVVLLSGDREEHLSWRAVGRRQFEAAYASDDSIYEVLIDHTSAR